jgi:hypothetical protein
MMAMPEPLPPPPPPPPAPAPSPLANVTSKFGATLYGFAEADMIHDSTQSGNDNLGNPVLQKTGLGADKGRTMFGIKNSRLGFKLKGPETPTLKSSGVFEIDFGGTQTAPPGGSESAYFAQPLIRARHYYLKFQTPFIDVLAGQTWHPFGWQGLAHPNTVQIQGVPGELFTRTPQLRLSHTFKSDAVDVELMAAAVRPAQRDSEIPDASGGLRVAFNQWKGVRTAGAAGTSLDPAQIAVTGLYRHFRLPSYVAAPKETVSINGGGVAADALLPLVPAKSDRDGNALTLTAEYVYGQAISDLYSAFNGGVGVPTTPGGMGAWSAFDADAGNVTYTADGTLHAVRWQTILAGLQYYVPALPEGMRLWFSTNYAHISSGDIDKLGNKALLHKEDWVDGNVFIDLNPAVRFGFEYAYTKQTFLDDTTAKNHRAQLSGFFIF